MRLKEYRLKNGYTQKEIAKKVNKSESGYNYYETGRIEPDIKTLITLANIYHITVDELIGRELQNIIDKGKLSKNQLDLIDKVLQLDDDNQKRLLGYVYALWQNQQNEKETIKKIKGE